MLDISSQKVAEVIVLARELDRAEPEFDGFVLALNDEELASLVAIMWIGRGSFEAADVTEAVATAATEATTPTVEYLKGTPHLADHLEAGLEALGESSTAVMEDLMGHGS